MAHLNTHDLNNILRRLPKDVLTIAKDGRLIIGGGFIRSCIAHEPVADIDIFSPSKMIAQAFGAKLAAMRGIEKPWNTKNAITVLGYGKTPVQFIHRWTFDDPEDVIFSFDYTIAQAAIWFDHSAGHWSSVVSGYFYQDMAAKRLRYLSPERHEDAGGSILRMSKFLRKGYSIAPEDMAAVISRLLGGIKGRLDYFLEHDEESRATVLAGILREVDPLTIVDGAPTDDCLEEDEGQQ